MNVSNKFSFSYERDSHLPFRLFPGSQSPEQNQYYPVVRYGCTTWRVEYGKISYYRKLILQHSEFDSDITLVTILSTMSPHIYTKPLFGLFVREQKGLEGDIPPALSGACGSYLNGSLYVFGGCDSNRHTNQVRCPGPQRENEQLTPDQNVSCSEQPEKANNCLTCFFSWPYSSDMKTICDMQPSL